MSNDERGAAKPHRVQRVRPTSGGLVQRVQRVVVAPRGADFKEKDTAAAAGCVEWLCSLRSREKVLEMNRPDGRMVLTWESSSLFPQHNFYFVLWIERKWGNIVL